MELFRLDKTSRQPDLLIDNRNSLIWTERYRNAGDFSFVTPDIRWVRTNLPLGSFIVIADSKEIQIVENYEIDINDDDTKVLKVSGRTLESFLEQRSAISSIAGLNSGGNPVTWSISSRTSAACAKYMMDYHIVTGTINVKDKLPNVSTVNSATGTLTTSARKISRGNLYERTLEVLSEDDLGIRVERPNFGSQGIIIRIYSGTDRTSSVIMSSFAETVEIDNYLQSLKDLKTIAYTANQTNGGIVIKASYGDGTGGSGFDRRVLTFACDDITDTTPGTPSIETNTRTRAELYNRNSINVFDSAVPPGSEYVFNQDYFLGDLLTASGDYFDKQIVQVTEFTRVEDDLGERSYPTLTNILDGA